MEQIRDLGVTITQNLTFHVQIEQTVQACNRMAGWIFRTFSSRDHQILLPLYKSLVLSRIEYCCLLWAPTNPGLISRLESVQRSFTRRLANYTGQNRPNYWERLKRLNMYSLERRRDRYAVLYVRCTNPGTLKIQGTFLKIRQTVLSMRTLGSLVCIVINPSLLS